MIHTQLELLKTILADLDQNSNFYSQWKFFWEKYGFLGGGVRYFTPIYHYFTPIYHIFSKKKLAKWL